MSFTLPDDQILFWASISPSGQATLAGACGEDTRPATEEEIAAVARMIAHNKSAAKPTKSSTIQAGFGVSRGGGATYTRASAIYDAIFAAPSEALYPTLTAEREKVSAS